MKTKQNKGKRRQLKKSAMTGNMKKINIMMTKGIQEMRRIDMNAEDFQGVLLVIQGITNIAAGKKETVKVTRKKEDDRQILPTRNRDGKAERTVRMQNIRDLQVTLRDIDQAMVTIGIRTIATQAMMIEEGIGNAITMESGIMKMKTERKRMKQKVQRLSEKVQKHTKNQVRRLLVSLLNAAQVKLSCQQKRDISHGNVHARPRGAQLAMMIVTKIESFQNERHL